MQDYLFPWWTNFGWMLVFSGIFLVLFHLFMVKLFPLTSVGWKKVDYVWVSLTFLGILFGVEQNREMYAKNYCDVARQRVERRFSDFKWSVEFGHSPAICREFSLSESSLPEEETLRLQVEYGAQCAWFKKLDQAISKIDPNKMEPIDLGMIQEPHPTGGDAWVYLRAEETVKEYNAEVKAFKKLDRLSKPTEIKDAAVALGPMLLAVAVALRLTKVTGEIRIDRVKAQKI